MKKENSIVFLGAWLDACSLWRLYLPYLNLPGSSFFLFASRPNFDKIADQSVCVVQRCCTPDHYKFIQVARGLGMKLVYDLDDNMWEIPRGNPAYGVLGKYKEGFAECMKYVDVISVSTRRLRNAVRKYVPVRVNPATGKEIPIIIADNRLDTKFFAPPVQRNEVVVGWAGSTSHMVDFEVMEKGYVAVAKANPQVTFEFRGCPPPDSIKNLPNFRFKLWSPVSEFGSRMPTWGWSVALAPLVGLNFNASKSCIKMMEAAYCKVPCLASWVDPYVEFCEHDQELKWLLCQDVQWERKINELIHDEARRKELGERAYRVLMQHYSWSRPHEGWEEIKSVLDI